MYITDNKNTSVPLKLNYTDDIMECFGGSQSAEMNYWQEKINSKMGKSRLVKLSVKTLRSF